MEMITASEMYWLTRLDYIRGVASGFSILLGIVSAIGLGVWAVHSAILWEETRRAKPRDDEVSFFTASTRACRRIVVPSALVFLVCLLTRVFVPTTKEMAAIKVVPMLATEKVQEDAGELYDLTVDWMKTQLGEKK
jgi:H+/Cl- antiporter ClcA